MKALTTAGLTKLIQLIKSSFISNTDTVTANTVTLATVATSGSYNDLSNKPTIGNGTITFTQGGVTKGTITTNQTGNSTIALDAGGGTVDQTFNGSSANAQSGVAIAGAGFLTSIPSSYLQNTASHKEALTINGTATSSIGAINIGNSSSASSTGAISIGSNSSATGSYSIALGRRAETSGQSSIQIGYGTNSTASSLSIGFQNSNNPVNYTLLDGTTGLIPDARISSNIARTSQIPSIMVDQTFDGTSANAQSGVAIAGAGFLQNTATGTDALTILGTASNFPYSINIGVNSSASYYATAFGYGATANDQYTTAIGYSAYANYQDTTAIGHLAQTNAAGTLAVGSNATASAQRATSIGYLSEASALGATALGYEAKATASGALQIGTGTNTTANTLQVGSYTLLDTSTGFIPDARISTNIARTNSVADTDLSNLSATGKTVIDGQWVSQTATIVENLQLHTNNNISYTLSDIPNDGYKYEVIISCLGVSTATSGQATALFVSSSELNYAQCVYRGTPRSAANVMVGGSIIIPLGTDRGITIQRSEDYYGTANIYLRGYRRIGSNT